MTDFVSPAVQAMNVIRYIGDEVSRSGEPIYQLPEISKVIGAPTEIFAQSIVEQLYDRGLLKMMEPMKTSDGTTFMMVELTLEGWEEYEEEKRGRLSGNYGFIAMAFGKPELTPIVDCLKEQISHHLGYKLVHMRDRERAGIIDDLLRIEIRDSAFVVSDLTHDNPGAYWEAGFAEGLGKPVVYICEETKFDREKTHFDTNHCTTITWSHDNKEEFAKRLIATLRRSLADN